MSKNKKKIFSGAATALVTPFDGGKIDYISFARLIDYQIENGIDALLVNGTTGESSTLTNDERKSLIKFAVDTVAGRVPLMAGTGCNCTQMALELSDYACCVGCDAVLVVTPYYNKATDSGLVGHYTYIADRISKPLMLYNVPSRTGVNISHNVYRELAKHENIVGVKEASSSISDFGLLSQECGNDLYLYSGNDDMILPSLSLGGSGVISVLSNIFPREVHDMCRYFFEGNVEKSKNLQLKFYPLIKALFCEVNPIPVKTALSYLGFCKDEFRLPLCKISDSAGKRLVNELKSLEQQS